MSEEEKREEEKKVVSNPEIRPGKPCPSVAKEGK